MEQVAKYTAVSRTWLESKWHELRKDKEQTELERQIADHKLAMTITGLTLDQLRTEHHVVTQQLDRNLWKTDEDKARLLERQDKLEFMIKKEERRGK